MKLEFKDFTKNLTDAMRSAGYHYDGQDQKTGELRFYRSLSSGLYPRFHIYGTLEKAAKKLTLNLHLDQKAPVYKGSTAHGGDYEGPVIEKEAERIRQFLGAGPKLPTIDILD
jgi:hypothetical protein